MLWNKYPVRARKNAAAELRGGEVGGRGEMVTEREAF